MSYETKFPDGYTVTISERGSVVVVHGTKRQSAHATHWGEVPAGSAGAAAIIKAGGRIEDYLHANPAGNPMIIRAGQGVREAVYAAADTAREEIAARDVQWAAEKAAAEAKALAECGLADPVRADIEYFDGTACWIRVGTEKESPDWSKVSVPHGLMERAELDRLTEIVNRRNAAKLVAAEQARKEAANAMNAAKAAAAATGQPVVLRRWTTERCMCRSRDCSFDNATERVFPNGSLKVSYSCCY